VVKEDDWLKGPLGVQEYRLKEEPDFRANLSFKPDENGIFYATPEFRTHEDSEDCFGWWASYGGTLYGPGPRGRTFLISKEGLSEKEMAYLIKGFSGFGEFKERGDILMWTFK